MMEVPVPKKEEKREEKEKKIIEKEQIIEPKKMSLTFRILDFFFGWPKYDPETQDTSLSYKLSYWF